MLVGNGEGFRLAKESLGFRSWMVAITGDGTRRRGGGVERLAVDYHRGSN
jgi:hypothetical protein